MYVHLFAKSASSAEAYGKADTIYYGMVSPPFVTLMNSQGDLDLKYEKYVIPLPFIQQGLAPPCPCHCLYLEASVHRGQVPAEINGGHLSPASKQKLI